DNIRVNCLVPGGIDTPQSRNFIKLRPNVRLLEDAHKNWGALKRFGTAEEVANVALFLASDEASFVTGAPFIVDAAISRNKQMNNYSITPDPTLASTFSIAARDA